jgi:hypothetical protein
VIDEPLPMRLTYFMLVLIPTIGVTLYTMLKSRRLSDFFETLADERRSSRDKLAAFVNVWRKRRDRDKEPR